MRVRRIVVVVAAGGSLMSAPSPASSGGRLGAVKLFHPRLPASPQLSDLAPLPHGGMAFTESVSGVIGWISANGTVHEQRVPTGRQPTAPLADPSGGILALDPFVSSLLRVAPGGRVSERRLGFAHGLVPNSLAYDGAGNLWVGMQSKICRVRTGAAAACWEIPLAAATDVPAAGSLTRGSDGDVWFEATIDPDINALGRVTPDGQITLFRTGAMPSAIVGTRTGASWFVDARGIGQIASDGTITRVADAPPAPAIASIAAGSPTTAYVTDGRRRVGRVTADGRFTWQDVGAHAQPRGIAVASDGTVWFTEAHGVARLTPAR
jgi:streptogramin lyase